MKASAVPLGIFGLLWSLIVLVFDGVLVRSWIDEFQSLSYVETTGRILASRVSEDHGGDSTTYDVRISYEYNHGGVRHESDRLRAARINTHSSGSARRLAASLRPGEPCAVYLNPENPAEAVLFRGFSGESVFMALFLTPFNLVMAFLWHLVRVALQKPKPLGGSQVLAHGGRLHVRHEPAPPFLMGFIVWGGVSFFGVFLVSFAFEREGFGTAAGAVWMVGLASGLAVWGRLRRRNPLTHPDLVIDPLGGTLRLTPAKARPALVLPLEDIAASGCVQRVESDGDGGEKTTHAVVVRSVRKGVPADHETGSWGCPREAESFAVWLRETLGVGDLGKLSPPPPGGVSGPSVESWDNPAWR